MTYGAKRMTLKILSNPGEEFDFAIAPEEFYFGMAFAPRNYFFPTIEAFTDNVHKRAAFLRVLESAKGLSVSDALREDFLSRND